MAKEVIMPKFGFTQETADLLKWLVEPGAHVEKGDPIAEVTTDKVDMEVEAPASGILDGIRYQEGETVPVTAIIAYIRQPDETLPPAPDAPTASTAAPSPSPDSPPAPPAAPSLAVTPVASKLAADLKVDLSQVQGSGPGGRITRRDVEQAANRQSTAAPAKVRAVPAARRLAREQGIDLATITGSGPRGRVQSRDVAAALAQAPAPPLPPAGEADVAEVIPLEGMRRTIAQRMQASFQQAPHTTFSIDINATAVQELRQRLNAIRNEGQPRVSLTAILVKACGWALRRNLRMNARLADDRILVLSDVHIGVAVALDDGLIVPVIHYADQKGIWQLAAEVNDLSERARSGKLRAQDLQGGTFTISNLGMFGIDRFTAIINPPETGILAVGSLRRQPVALADDEIAVRPVFTLTLSADHRTVDGAIAAHFMNDLRTVLEYPPLLSA